MSKGSHDRCQLRTGISRREHDDHGGRPVRCLGPKRSASAGVQVIRNLPREVTAIKNCIDGFADLPMIGIPGSAAAGDSGGCGAGVRQRRHVQSPSASRTHRRQQQAVVSTGDGGLMRIVVESAIQPDPELSGQAMRSGCGELHLVRVSGCRSSWLPDGAPLVLGADTFGLRP